jgi:hypothetical protein
MIITVLGEAVLIQQLLIIMIIAILTMVVIQVIIVIIIVPEEAVIIPFLVPQPVIQLLPLLRAEVLHQGTGLTPMFQ